MAPTHHKHADYEVCDRLLVLEVPRVTFTPARTVVVQPQHARQAVREPYGQDRRDDREQVREELQRILISRQRSRIDENRLPTHRNELGDDKPGCPDTCAYQDPHAPRSQRARRQTRRAPEQRQEDKFSGDVRCDDARDDYTTAIKTSLEIARSSTKHRKRGTH